MYAERKPPLVRLDASKHVVKCYFALLRCTCFEDVVANVRSILKLCKEVWIVLLGRFHKLGNSLLRLVLQRVEIWKQNEECEVSKHFAFRVLETIELLTYGSKDPVAHSLLLRIDPV